MTPKQAANRMIKWPNKLLQEIIKAELASAKEAKREAIKWSMGRISTLKLAAMGHPYARRDPRPPQDPAIINRQTGLFVRSWFIIPPSSSKVSRGLLTQIVNLAPYSGFMRGTSRMIERPLVDRVYQKIAKRRYKRLEQAIQNSWK